MKECFLVIPVFISRTDIHMCVYIYVCINFLSFSYVSQRLFGFVETSALKRRTWF